MKVIAHSEDTPLKEKVLIADDWISAKTGDVRLLFVSDGRKNWQLLLCADLGLLCTALVHRSVFKDAKQKLYMSKEQSNTFDALIGCHSLVMIRYLLLV